MSLHWINYVEIIMETQESINMEITHSFLLHYFCRLKSNKEYEKLK